MGGLKMDKKVVMFPHLETRIIENGLEYFKNKQYYDAIELFEEGLELGINPTLFKSALVISYIETNQLEKGRKLILELLDEDDENYTTNLNLAVMILVQLNDHEQIIKILKEAFENDLIDEIAYNHFKGLYDLSEKLVHKEGKSTERRFVQLDLFNYETMEEQMAIVKELLAEKISPYKKEIGDYLIAEDGQLFFKTLLIMMLEDKEDSSEYKVVKFNKEMSFIPEELIINNVQPTKERVIDHFHQKYENDNPTYLNQLLDYIERCYFLMYPFDYDGYSMETILAGIQYQFEKLLNPVVEVKELIESYEANHSEFVDFIHQFTINE